MREYTKGVRMTHRHDIVVVGASAGGVEAVPRLVAGLPPDFPGSVFVVQHISPTAQSYLPKIIGRASALKAVHPVDKEKIENGTVYIAPPDHHLWLEDSSVRVTRGPRVNRHRPAVDPLFETAAHVYHQRVVGVVLTGSLGDGAAGLYMVKQCGGVAVVQDPADAAVPSMPQNALRYVKPDHLLPLERIPAVLGRLAGLNFKKRRIKCPNIRFSMEQCSERPDVMVRDYGPPSSIICPDCGGPLWELRDGKMVRYRCLTGHVFSPESLLDGEREELERALWSATKTLEERASLLLKLGEEAEEHNQPRAAKTFAERSKNLQAQAEVIRKIVKKLDPA